MYHLVTMCVTLCVAMTTASQFNVDDCSLKCTSAKKGLQNVSLRQTGCYWPDGHLGVSNLHLDVNPFLLDDKHLFNSCSEELRWIPSFEATWRAPNNVTRYEVQLHDLPLRSLSHLGKTSPPLKSTCFHVQVDDPHYRNCEFTCNDVPSPSVLVRILLNSSHSLSMEESTIHFHRWFQGNDYGGNYKGLSLFYRRQLMPWRHRDLTVGRTPNPRHWATILKVYNNSDSRDVFVTFDLSTVDVRVGGYDVKLFKYNTVDPKNSLEVDRIIIDERSLTNETTGSWTFYNVSTGIYFVRVEMWTKNTRVGQCLTKIGDRLESRPKDPCFVEGGTSSCLHVDSGLVTIIEPPIPQARYALEPTHHPQFIPGATQSPLSRHGLAIMLAGMVAATAVVIILSLLIFIKVKGRQNDNLRNVIVIPGSPGKPAVPDESDASKSITVFLVYSRDNRAHIQVVNKFAQLLRQVGNCNVILDMEDKAIARYTAIDWVDAQLKESDKVIFIKSEGALRRMQLDNDKLYAKIETENLGPTFTASVRAMDVRSIHNRGNYMVVSFAYSNQKDLREDKLLTIVGNNSQFQLMTELNSLLLAIRDLSQCQAGFFRTVYAGQGEALSSTLAYIELQKAIDEAVDYHHTKPNWFQYEAEPRVKKPVDDSTVVETTVEEPEPEEPLSMFSVGPLPPIVQAMVAPSSQESLNQLHSDMSSSEYSEPGTLSEQLPCWSPDGEQCCDSGFRSISQSDLGGSGVTPPTVTFPYFGGTDHTTGTHDLYAPESVSSSYMEDLDKQEQELLPNEFCSFAVPNRQDFPEHLERTDLLFGQFGNALR